MQPTNPDGFEAHILIVDDHEDIASLFSWILRQAGFQTTVASSGPEALEFAQSQEFDLALIDILMPEMDGPSTLVRLREILPQVRALFITGHSGLYELETLLELGAHGLLLKPILPARLVEAVKECLLLSPA
ncbi:response regulator [Tuwongella immobilis]|uniref:Response regulatory domain-containing protein n=1 Tax=Tuwongella immobilis TaxID=692036 RepID=A0A6C2YRK1_9BACT|nr:response regulator [Tuwongella immobilis]VIP04288.1 chemotaxis protein : PhoP family transcriptional regulator OS=Pontibacillus litoralis JSM 072002 GN=N784_01820 PE=4 SV=1: Response_reg [Tuwongella immobilis]VTS05939.1 chemotaxis protein : PhoP family transcriptional regulator OS=Pontibacillus litoralis JSM 072002 GN=N784_01820 PE=4 SV=1: Response_reg [Tuwongella immobilis]